MSKITNTFVKLSQKQLEQKYNFIQNYKKAQNAAIGSSVDANSNVTSKNVATLSAEIHKDINVQLKRFCVSKEIEKLFGKDLADEYNRQIESHEIYVHDESHPFFDYCASVTMYPFLLSGLKGLGGESAAPKHLESFCGGFINLVFALSSQLAGALATTEFLLCFDYFSRKDFGDNYLETNKKDIENALQQVIYSINQPASARGFQSVFWNLSIFDDNYLKSLFGDFVFPDMSTPNFDSLKKLQAFFMSWFNEERRKALLTFPVVTAAMVVDENGPLDKEFLDMCAEQDSKGNSFFKYESDSVDSLSSCCFSGDQKVIVRAGDKHVGKVYYERFDKLGLTKDGPNRKKFLVLHNGSWVKGNLIDLPKRPMYKITTTNNKTIVVSDNHLNPCLRGDIETTKLTTNDYLLFNTRELNAFPEQDKGLTFEQGYAVGAFLGDGSFGSRTKYGILDINYSLNKTTKLQRSVENFKKVLKQFESSANVGVKIYPDTGLVPVRMSCKKLVEFIQYWTNWKEGTKAPTKKLNMDCLLQSIEFRKGILAGWYDTDGGNSNRCYTTSPELAENMEALISSLGKVSTITITDRTGEVAFEENGKQYLRKYPLYCVRWYDPKNKRSMGNVYKVYNNSIFFRIKSIEKINYSGRIYCFEMEDKNEPYFTLPNGIITHNCRLKSELVDKQPFSFSLGAGGVQAGSINVITLNANRLVQNAVRDGKDIYATIKEQVEKIHKYQIATRSYFEQYLEAGMAPLYSLGYLSLDKKFLTTGINGLLESAEFLGYKPSNNEEYKKYTSSVLKVIYDADKADYDKYKDAYWQEITFNNKTYNIFSLKKLKVVDTEYNDEVCLSWKDIILDKERYIIEESELEKANGRIE